MSDRDAGNPGHRIAARVADAAERAVARMRAHGFEHAQVSVAHLIRHEVNIAHNEPSLMRSTESPNLSMVGIFDGRKASMELSALEDDEALEARLAGLRAEVESAPTDDANAVSSGQCATLEQGPQRMELDVLRHAARSLLDFRGRRSPRTTIEEAFVSYRRRQWRTLTSGGSDLSGSVGWYEASVFCVARDGKAVSSFNGAGGTADGLDGELVARFGIGDMLCDTERQVRPRLLGAPFVGSVVLAPAAVEDLLAWLLGQLGDAHLIGRTSLYRDKVGQEVASPLLTLRSRFDAPGIAAVSADAFRTPAVEVLAAGTLRCLLPTLYGSRKTGLAHVPTAAGGWELAAGSTSSAQLVEGVERGALVGRLSMGRPASNGDFSGVIKNSFAIENGRPGDALSETMISGNVARMLLDVDGVSSDRIDCGTTQLPWLRVPGMHFS
jgi:PmbA protein